MTPEMLALLRPSYPALLPDFFILQITPQHPLGRLREHSLNFDPFDLVARFIWLDDFGDQEMLVFVHWLDSSPFGQQQFFRVERVHAAC